MTSNRWSYLIAEIKPSVWGKTPPERVQEELARHGQQGWELVSVTQAGPMGPTRLYFKRPQ